MATIARETIERHGSADQQTTGLNESAIPANPWADAPVKAANRSKRSHIFGRVLGVALATMLVLPMAEATQTAEAGKKFKTITETISSNGQIDIPDAGTQGPANPYPATIVVDEFEKFKKAEITDVNLILKDVSHTAPLEIDVMLALDNRRAVVMSDVGGGADINDLTITLDDQADDDLPIGAVLSEGSFRPTNFGAGDVFPAPAPVANDNVALSTFKGEKPDGTWQLFVNDDAAGDTGTISGGWELEITAKVKEDKKDKDDKGKGKKGKGKGKKNDD